MVIKQIHPKKSVWNLKKKKKTSWKIQFGSEIIGVKRCNEESGAILWLKEWARVVVVITKKVTIMISLLKPYFILIGSISFHIIQYLQTQNVYLHTFMYISIFVYTHVSIFTFLNLIITHKLYIIGFTLDMEMSQISNKFFIYYYLLAIYHPIDWFLIFEHSMVHNHCWVLI